MATIMILLFKKAKCGSMERRHGVTCKANTWQWLLIIAIWNNQFTCQRFAQLESLAPSTLETKPSSNFWRFSQAFHERYKYRTSTQLSRSETRLPLTWGKDQDQSSTSFLSLSKILSLRLPLMHLVCKQAINTRSTSSPSTQMAEFTRYWKLTRSLSR